MNNWTHPRPHTDESLRFHNYGPILPMSRPTRAEVRAEFWRQWWLVPLCGAALYLAGLALWSFS